MQYRSAWTAAAITAVTVNAQVAGASEPPSPEPRAESACADPSERLHDGLFVRSEPGIAYLWAQVSDSGPSPRRSKVRGIGQSSSLLVGGTPARGLVLGGSLWSARIDPKFVEDEMTVDPDDDSVKVTVLHVGPFLDFYPDATRGLHASVGAGALQTGRRSLRPQNGLRQPGGDPPVQRLHRTA